MDPERIDATSEESSGSCHRMTSVTSIFTD